MSGGYSAERADELAAALRAELAQPYEECPYCTCCSRLGCYRGDDSDCPFSENTLAYLCPCTEE